MLNYQKLTLSDVLASADLREALRDDYFNFKQISIDANCDIDVRFAFSDIIFKIMKTRRWEMIIDSLVDYSQSKSYSKDSITDEEVDALLEAVPEYSSYFVERNTAEEVEAEAEQPKRKRK